MKTDCTAKPPVFPSGRSNGQDANHRHGCQLSQTRQNSLSGTVNDIGNGQYTVHRDKLCQYRVRKHQTQNTFA